MKLLSSWQKKIKARFQVWNPRSLRFRLTLAITTVSVVGMGGLAIWLGLTMQRILISAHKDNVLYLAERLPQDVEIYEEMFSQPEAIQRAVENLSRDNIFIWVEDSQEKIIARTGGLNTPQPLPVSPDTTNFPFPGITLSEVNGRYWVLCASPLVVNGDSIGDLYLVQDIHAEQVMFLHIMRNLAVATVIAIAGISVAGGIYVARSLLPLRRICQLTESISADHLGETRIELNRAPTEVQQLAQRFDEMLMRLHTAWEQQRQFVSNVSHELRTPLTIVSGYLQSVQRRGKNLNEPQQEALAIATSEADRTIQLLEDLLTLARVDNGQMQFQLETISLNAFIDQIIELSQQYHDRAINYHARAEELKIYADSNRLKQVILNLLDNAIKYSEPEDPVTIMLERKQKLAVLSVRDRGIGIPFAQQTRIFERFYRVDEARSRTTGGTGLGLSIVKTLVEGMGGNIKVSSRLAEGTTFTMTFPTVA
ncbi:MAG: sensor histidine kinase [Halothece sp.]